MIPAGANGQAPKSCSLVYRESLDMLECSPSTFVIDLIEDVFT